MAKIPTHGIRYMITVPVERSRFFTWYVAFFGINSLIILLLLVAAHTAYFVSWNGFSLSVSVFAPHQDDPKCLSRTQQWSLRSQSKFSPVPSLLADAWERYGELHRRCSEGKNWTDFFPKEQDQVDDCKYLIYLDGVEGIGNRFLSLASAWIYALTTDRVLLVDNRRKLDDLLCEPFPKSSWILPNDFPYQQVDDSPSLSSVKLKNHSSTSIVKLYLRHDQTPDDSLFFCADTYASLMDVRWVAWHSNQYYIPNMILVQSFWQRLKVLFPDPDQIYALISRLILLPSNEVWALVLQEYRGHLASSKMRVGVQIRLMADGWDPAVFDANTSDMIINCLVRNNFLPKVTPPGPNANELVTMNTRKLQTVDEKQVDVGVLVASLQGKYYRKMKDIYNEHTVTVDGKVVRVHSVSELGKEDGSFLQSQLAFAEMFLLSFSDLLATSGSSTFGYAAQSWANVFPLMLDFEQLNKSPRGDICAKGIGHSVEPCTHMPERPHCLQGDPIQSLSTDHKQWMLKHLHYCQDRPFAWQLVQHNDKPEPVFEFQI